jgi:hypothetical protein
MGYAVNSTYALLFTTGPRGIMQAHRVCNHLVPEPRGSSAVRGFDFFGSYHSKVGETPS